MDLFEAIEKRFSYRKEMDQTEIPLEDLKKIVQAGLDAPSGVNAQTTGFIIIRNPNVVKAIREMPKANGSMATAAAYIACHVARKPVETYMDMSFDIEDCAAAVENMFLATTAMGYGTVWIDGWLRKDNRATKIAELTGLEDDRVIRIILPIGKMLQEQEKRVKKPFEERVSVV
ncbi:MAG: hypothetical protein B6241_05240 [Spirochaetaceae bacterium 4572_59]|nr:MAG: hypothetical protein B6241_05240 [Spirochaetaceae bacterium 4572_59]